MDNTTASGVLTNLIVQVRFSMKPMILFKLKFQKFHRNLYLMQDDSLSYPSIAQLAERETVEAEQLSLGHWFESGWTETFFNFYGFQLVFPSSVHVTSQTIL